MHDITALRFAVLTATTLSFARAAMLSGVKQATLSRRVALLEERLGLRLFDRSTRGAIPTEHGLTVIDVARRILADLDKLQEDSRSIGVGRAGHIGLGFSASLSSGSLRTLIADLVTRYPELRVTGLEGNRGRLMQALAARTIDFAVMSGDLADTEFARRPLWAERVMALLYDDHPLAGKERIYWPDLRKERFILPQSDPGPDLADMINARLIEPGFRPDVEVHEVTRDNVANMVPLGRFISVTTDATLGRVLPGIALRDIYDASGGFSTIGYAGFWRQDNDSPVLARLLELLNERYPA